MRLLKRLGLLLIAGLLSGCLQVQDELTLNNDGSGTVRLKVTSNLPEEWTAMLAMSRGPGGRGGTFYPPVNESEAKRFFPARDFTLKVDEKSAADGKTLVVEAVFKDLNTLLASPYARAHQLAFQTGSNGTLKLQAIGAGEAAARAADIKADDDMARQLSGIEDLQKKTGEMRFEFRITLPSAVTEANGTRDGKTVTWTVERARCKDQEEFASRLGALLEAGCTAGALKLTAVTPPRLALLPFSRLAEGKVAGAEKPPDTNKIAAATRFVPYSLHVTRSLDLSGEGGGRQSQAHLTGAVLLPAELAPHQWGEVKLEEALDAKGTNLMPKEDGDSIQERMTQMEMFGTEGGPDDEDEAEAGQEKDARSQHMIALSFKAPDWTVKEIAKIKGRMTLQYWGGLEVIKLTNAVPASLVMTMNNPSKSAHLFGGDSERGQLADPRLAALGLSLRVQMAMVQSGMTFLQVETGGGKAALRDAQVFDADGRPWPTTLVEEGSSGLGNRSSQIMVTGQPKPPFSLGLVVSGLGASVAVPLLVEKVPVGAK